MQTAETDALERTVLSAISSLVGMPIACAFELIDATSGLLDQEAALVIWSAQGRYREFCAGRRCARRALASFGCPSLPILRGNLGEPLWPKSFGGSITHGSRFAGALAFRLTSTERRATIDLIDALDPEPYLEIEADITHPDDEIATDRDGKETLFRFSAKEAAIKALSPIVGDYIEPAKLRARRTECGFRVNLAGVTPVVEVISIYSFGKIVSIGITEESRGK